MLAHPVEDGGLETLDPSDFLVEYKWDGIRIQAVSEDGVRRLYTRTGDDISHTFPDVLAGLEVAQQAISCHGQTMMDSVPPGFMEVTDACAGCTSVSAQDETGVFYRFHLGSCACHVPWL